MFQPSISFLIIKYRRLSFYVPLFLIHVGMAPISVDCISAFHSHHRDRIPGSMEKTEGSGSGFIVGSNLHTYHGGLQNYRFHSSRSVRSPLITSTRLQHWWTCGSASTLSRLLVYSSLTWLCQPEGKYHQLFYQPNNSSEILEFDILF